MQNNRLRQLRRARGMSQVELSARSGVKRATISQIENGHDPSPRTVRMLTEFFDVPGEWLLGLDDVPKRSSKEKQTA